MEHEVNHTAKPTGMLTIEKTINHEDITDQVTHRYGLEAEIEDK